MASTASEVTSNLFPETKTVFQMAVELASGFVYHFNHFSSSYAVKFFNFGSTFTDNDFDKCGKHYKHYEHYDYTDSTDRLLSLGKGVESFDTKISFDITGPMTTI